MGLDINGIRALIYCKELGVDFSHTATIGRQRLYLSRWDLRKVFRSFGYRLNKHLVDSIFNQYNGYAEKLLNYLGAEEIHSFDKSDYEGATDLQDMNIEVQDIFKRRYSVVLDSGSLEHVFNFPAAIKNCMEMTMVGGHYIAISPANNFFGHGFYQFSPELYFSTFTQDNGFELTHMIAFKDIPYARWYSVKSTFDVKGRVTMNNSVPTYLFVVAKKTDHKIVFTATPQQSDYLAEWANASSPRRQYPGNIDSSISKKQALRKSVIQQTPASIKRLVLRILRRYNAGFNPRFFHPFDPTNKRKST